jgi:serine/threonine-protein kinase
VPEAWIGKTVGNCRIEEKIGEGGCGEVYRAVDLMLDRPVAIKVLHPRLASRRDLAERFRSEALLLARLSHPNVATLYSFHQEGDAYLMVMEFVRGRTFDALIRERGRMSPDEALPLLFQALDGIEHAHALGVIHRDLKGSNVMRADTGVVKVMDFGIARALGSPGLTQGDHPIGTPEYMPPEQVRAAEIDGRADVYALGALLFKMLTGRLPFTGKSHFDVLRAQVEEAPPSLRAFAPGLPAALDAVVARALAKSPDERFQSVAELRRALEEAGGHPPHAEEEAPTQVLPRAEPAVVEEWAGASPTLPVDDRPRWPVRRSIGIGAFVALALALAWLGWRGTRPPSGPGAEPVPLAEAGPLPAPPAPLAAETSAEAPSEAAGAPPALTPAAPPESKAAPARVAKSRPRPAAKRTAAASTPKAPAAKRLDASAPPANAAGWHRETAETSRTGEEEPRDRWVIRRQ